MRQTLLTSTYLRCSFQITIEWLFSLLWDLVLIFAEVIIHLWLALVLKDRLLLSQYRAIVILFFVPSLLNAFIWVCGLNKSYPRIGFNFMLALIFFGFPSPVFVYVWHLYLSAFTVDLTHSTQAKVLANTFRVVQALTSSVPLLIVNLYTLFDIMSVNNGLDISLLTNHLAEVNIHGLAALMSLFNVLRAASVFNERRTFTLLFVMIGYPYLLFTVLSRLLSLGIIVSFLDIWWTITLFIGLFLTNLSLYYVTRKEQRHRGRGHRQVQLKPVRGDIEEQIEMRARMAEDGSITTSSTSSLRGKVTWWTRNKGWITKKLPKISLLSVCSSIIPVAYTNDLRSHHPQIKGGLFILLNYLFNTLWIGLALGFTIVNDVPNTIHGVSFPQPSLKLKVPDSKVSLFNIPPFRFIVNHENVCRFMFKPPD